jgi:hypothetical protein
VTKANYETAAQYTLLERQRLKFKRQRLYSYSHDSIPLWENKIFFAHL